MDLLESLVEVRTCPIEVTATVRQRVSSLQRVLFTLALVPIRVAFTWNLCNAALRSCGDLLAWLTIRSVQVYSRLWHMLCCWAILASVGPLRSPVSESDLAVWIRESPSFWDFVWLVKYWGRQDVLAPWWISFRLSSSNRSVWLTAGYWVGLLLWMILAWDLLSLIPTCINDSGLRCSSYSLAPLKVAVAASRVADSSCLTGLLGLFKLFEL